jgi:hypothetical protein
MMFNWTTILQFLILYLFIYIIVVGIIEYATVHLHGIIFCVALVIFFYFFSMTRKKEHKFLVFYFAIGNIFLTLWYITKLLKNRNKTLKKNNRNSNLDEELEE